MTPPCRGAARSASSDPSRSESSVSNAVAEAAGGLYRSSAGRRASGSKLTEQTGQRCSSGRGVNARTAGDLLRLGLGQERDEEEEDLPRLRRRRVEEGLQKTTNRVSPDGTGGFDPCKGMLACGECETWNPSSPLKPARLTASASPVQALKRADISLQTNLS